jgi:hypothetical protein
LGIDAVTAGNEEVLCWATDLIRGGSIQGVKFAMDKLPESSKSSDHQRRWSIWGNKPAKEQPLEKTSSNNNTGVYETNEEGVVIIPNFRSGLLIAQHGNDVAFLQHAYVNVNPTSKKLLWHTFDG